MVSQACVKNSVRGGGVYLWSGGFTPPGQTSPPGGQTPPPGQKPPRALQDMINMPAVRILLECILVQHSFGQNITNLSKRTDLHS